MVKVFDRLVALICEKMSESLETDHSILASGDGSVQSDGTPAAEKPKSRCSC